MDQEPKNIKPVEVPVYTPPENPIPPILKQVEKQSTVEERLEIINVNLSLVSLVKDLSLQEKFPGVSLNQDTITCIKALEGLTPQQISEDRIALNMLTSAIYQGTNFFRTPKISDSDLLPVTGLDKLDTIETYTQEHQRIYDTWETDLQGAVPIFLKHVVVQTPQ